MLEVLTKTLLSYLMGSVVGSLLLGRLRDVDIRTMGSGNAGGTNALRTQGPIFAAGVMAIDIGKSFFAVWLIAGATFPMVPGATPTVAAWIPVACAAGAVLGHCYPVWYGLRGGKGAATLIGAYLALAPMAVIPMLAMWAVIIVVLGFVGLGTVLASLTVPVYLGLGPDTAGVPLLTFAWLMAAFMIYTHRSNIRRMLRGTEPRLGSAIAARRRRECD